ncbi:MAG: ethanolamine ammonia-lyase subunit EutC [Candidatus Schekmanbacteria bacterium]|nr:ethanolamine ammonia-lyase subunit EutC [Candidatus Schekmanbacteria bacterium]
MNENTVEQIVVAVVRELQRHGVDLRAGVSADRTRPRQEDPAEAPALATNGEPPLPDLAGEEYRLWVGIGEPDDGVTLRELRASTPARVASGRSGPRLRTVSLLRFSADCSRARDTVHKEISDAWIQERGLFAVSTCAADKRAHLTRPDRGRELSAAASQTIRARCAPDPDVQIVVSDGLSSDAIAGNYDDIMPALTAGFRAAGLTLGTPFLVRNGRVKVQDEIAALLGARVIVLLIGERPGLAQSDSLSAYLAYRPAPGRTVESDRTVVSNIHGAGTPPVEAAAVIVGIAQDMIAQQAGGIHLRQMAK